MELPLQSRIFWRGLNELPETLAPTTHPTAPVSVSALESCRAHTASYKLRSVG